MSLDDFSGVARLFPLPDLVMFPHVVQPLRIFEPRYVAMLDDALETDRLIAMALFTPGWKSDYEGNPPVFPNVCLGQILSEAEADDGSFSVFLAGLARARIVEEHDTVRPFRTADVELLPDVYRGDVSCDDLQEQLVDLFRRLMPPNKTTDDVLGRILNDNASLGMLVDVIAFALPLALDIKLKLLAEPVVESRAQLLIRQIQEFTKKHIHDSERLFPPDFSIN